MFLAKKQKKNILKLIFNILFQNKLLLFMNNNEKIGDYSLLIEIKIDSIPYDEYRIIKQFS